MAKVSAGILVFRRHSGTIEVLLGHAGGPFLAKKDAGAWDIPKGQLDENEDHVSAAKREFAEEMGAPCPDGELVELGSLKNRSGKTIYIWAVEGDFDADNIKSNTFELEWPPKSGQKQEFPEIDRAAWVPIENAGEKLHRDLDEFILRLATKLSVEIPPAPGSGQATLF